MNLADRCIRASSRQSAQSRGLDKSLDVKSYRVQNYHQTYIIKIMDITAYFLSLLLDWPQPALPLASFLLAGCDWPMGGQAQVYIVGWVIYKETTNPTRFPIMPGGPASVWSAPGEIWGSLRAFKLIIFLYLCMLNLADGGVVVTICRREYSALRWEDRYHLLRLLLRLSHKHGLQCWLIFGLTWLLVARHSSLRCFTWICIHYSLEAAGPLIRPLNWQ